MTLKDKLLKRLPKKYHERVKSFYEDEGLIDDCKYIVQYTDNFTDGECFGGSIPVRSISEAIQFIKESLYKYWQLSSSKRRWSWNN